MKIISKDFEFVTEFAMRKAAIVIEKGKEYLVESRFAPLAKQHGCSSLEEYVAKLRIESSMSEMHRQAIDALTTNETFFFRDFKPYEMLRKDVLPELIEQCRSSRRLNIWSAACSTGQEPYSLAMLLSERFPELETWDVSIFATDLSPTVLDQAKSGTYNQFEVNRGLPAPLLFKYFDSEDKRWRIKKSIRDKVTFKEMNLIQAWPIFPPMDLVLIRNVLIYFNTTTKKTILKKIRACMRPHGKLLLGSSETTVNLDPEWEPVTYDDSVAYRKNESN
ncbi:MAG: chemotaxis protein methyltransferase CheR [Candidatus Pelagisphaera sp.]|jgi:chemotaxis protein methyltransferase CheR